MVYGRLRKRRGHGVTKKTGPRKSRRITGTRRVKLRRIARAPGKVSRRKILSKSNAASYSKTKKTKPAKLGGSRKSKLLRKAVRQAFADELRGCDDNVWPSAPVTCGSATGGTPGGCIMTNIFDTVLSRHAAPSDAVNYAHFGSSKKLLMKGYRVRGEFMVHTEHGEHPDTAESAIFRGAVHLVFTFILFKDSDNVISNATATGDRATYFNRKYPWEPYMMPRSTSAKQYLEYTTDLANPLVDPDERDVNPLRDPEKVKYCGTRTLFFDPQNPQGNGMSRFTKDGGAATYYPIEEFTGHRSSFDWYIPINKATNFNSGDDPESWSPAIVVENFSHLHVPLTMNTASGAGSGYLKPSVWSISTQEEVNDVLTGAATYTSCDADTEIQVAIRRHWTNAL